MRGRMIGAVLLLVALFAGIGIIGTAAYQAGLAQAATVAGAGGTVVVAGAPWGWGFGWGLGFFGILGPILFFFIILGLARSAFGGFGRRGGAGPWASAGPGGQAFGPGRRGDWYESARRVHDDWHREAGTPGPSSAGVNLPTGTTPTER